jgi:hypothetical protein
MSLHGRRQVLYLCHRGVRVSAVKFYSIRLRTLSASPVGRFPATTAPPAAAATASGRERRLFHA